MRKTVVDVPPLLRLQVSITDRDDRLLGWLYDHGVLKTDQIAYALFPSLDVAQRRLQRLTALGAVARFRPNRLDGGSFPYHYVLAQLGYEHVMGQRGLGLPRRDAARRRYQSLIARPDLRHLLGGNGVFTDLAAYERTHRGARLAAWLPAAAFHEPGSFYRNGSNMEVMMHRQGLPRPDGAGVWVQDGRSVPFFAEYDTGTERLDILTDKIDKYARLTAYAIVWHWPTLLVLPTLLRERHLHHRYQGDPGGGVVTTAVDYLEQAGQSPAEAVWWPIGDPHGRHRRLIDLPYLDPRHDDTWPTDADDDAG